MNNKRIRKSTMVELVVELKKLPQIDAVKFMIWEAEKGEYHDYKNEKYTCGKMESSNRLRKIAKEYPQNESQYIALAKQIENGDYDEEADEADCDMMRDTIKGTPLDSTAGKELFGL